MSTNRVSTVKTLDDGPYRTARCDDEGRLEVVVTPGAAASAVHLTNVKTVAYAASLVISAAPATLYGLTGYNSKNTGQFIQLFNLTALPADATVPSVVLWVDALSSFSLDFGVNGRYFSTGIVLSNSSTGPTKTIGAADLWIDAQVL